MSAYLSKFDDLLDTFAPDQLIACNGHAMIFEAMSRARSRGITTAFAVRGFGYYQARDFCCSRGSPICSARAARTFPFSSCSPVRRPDRSTRYQRSISLRIRTSWPRRQWPLRRSTSPLTKILLVPSVWDEPFGRVAAEAMINGIPPLVGTRGALPDVIGGDFSSGGGGRVLPIPDWMSRDTSRLPTEQEVEPWYRRHYRTVGRSGALYVDGRTSAANRNRAIWRTRVAKAARGVLRVARARARPIATSLPVWKGLISEQLRGVVTCLTAPARTKL